MADAKSRLADAQRITANARVKLEELLAELASVRSQLVALAGPGAAPVGMTTLVGFGRESAPPLDLGATPDAKQDTGEAELLLEDFGAEATRGE